MCSSIIGTFVVNRCLQQCRLKLSHLPWLGGFNNGLARHSAQKEISNWFLVVLFRGFEIEVANVL